MLGLLVLLGIGGPFAIGIGVANSHGPIWGAVAGLFSFAVIGCFLLSDPQ